MFMKYLIACFSNFQKEVEVKHYSIVSQQPTEFLLTTKDIFSKEENHCSLETAFADFLVACEARALSGHTIEDYSRSIRMFISYVGDMPMQDVTTNQIAGFLASLKRKGAGEKTILNRHIGLAALWTWALKNNIVDRHVVQLVDKPKPKRIVIDPFTEGEIRSLLSVLRRKPDRDRAIIYLLLDTGMRASELVGLERKDINFNVRKIKVLGKGNKERLLPFSEKTADALLRHLANTQGKPFPISRTTLTHIMVRLGRRAGVSGCFPHRFRHTFAIQYLRNGGDAFTLQWVLDHSTMAMVSRYVKIAQIDADRVHKKASPVKNWMV